MVGILQQLASQDWDSKDLDEIDSRLEQVRDMFGFDRWRPGQLEAMRSFLVGRDVLVVLPTGAGKSCTYQVPALLGDGLNAVALSSHRSDARPGPEPESPRYHESCGYT